MVKAIIFDFDGVIGCSEKARFTAIRKCSKEKGVIIAESEFKNLLGKTSRVFLKNLLIKNLSDKLIDDILSSYTKEYKDKITEYVTPIEPVVNFIKKYNGNLKFAIASGTDFNLLTRLTTHFGIRDKFTVIIGKDQVTNFKPHPETYLEALKALKLKSEECIAIEDSPVGIQSALDSKIKCYVYLNGDFSLRNLKKFKTSGFLRTEDDFNILAQDVSVKVVASISRVK
jgi:HAD superfamily hydrolase (TIGR01509 family)